MTVTSPGAQARQVWWMAVAALGGFVALGLSFAWPHALERLTLAALHGLCAQRPSHSFWFGDQRLPFDARMTGIYGTFACVAAYLAARGRARRAAVPPIALLAFLGGGVVAVGVDGFNALFRDLGFPTLYEPRNWLRYVTGAWAGALLAVVLWTVASGVVWRPGAHTTRPVLESWRELAVIGASSAGFGLVAMTGWEPAYPALALALVVAAVLALTLLALPVVLLACGREQRVDDLRQLAGSGMTALGLALAFMAATSGLRFLIETLYGAPPLP